MLDALAELTKSVLIPGTVTFLLFGLTTGLLVAYGPRRARPLALPFLAALAGFYWVASVPVVADLLATRFHARGARQVTLADVNGANAIVVLGAGIHTHYVAGGHTVPIPDPQTVYNAIEAARIYHLFPEGLPVLASGGRQANGAEEEIESNILKEWLIRAGVPADRIELESSSRDTHEQAQQVAPLLKRRHWERFVLVTPAVHGPRAASVFRRQGVDPIPASAPYSSEEDGARIARWMPTIGALHVSQRAMYDYSAWAYYWARGWL